MSLAEADNKIDDDAYLEKLKELRAEFEKDIASSRNSLERRAKLRRHQERMLEAFDQSDRATARVARSIFAR